LETSSLLHPAEHLPKAASDPTVYEIDAATFVAALDHMATQPLPDPKQVFPWLHGLHAENQIQLAFFVARRKALRRIPRCIRGITVVKAGGDLTCSKLKGAISPDEILSPQTQAESSAFLEIDPKDGFSVRNFQIQACKMATCSDIVVYGDASTPKAEVLKTATRIAKAQRAWMQRQESNDEDAQPFSTFVVTGGSQVAFSR